MGAGTLNALSPFARHSSVGSLLLFGLETDNDAALNRDQNERLAAVLQLLEQHLQALLRPASSFGQRLLQDAQHFHTMLDVEEGGVCTVDLASRLLSVGYRHVALRRAEGGGAGSECFHNLRHSFLVVQGEGEDDSIDFIVEPHFRDSFEISQPTPRYAGLLAMVPDLLVASPAQLRPLVQLLFSEMSLAFEQQGLSLPPWRQAKSLLSKWLPSKARDVDLSPYASPRAGSPETCFGLALGEGRLDLGPPSTSGRTGPPTVGGATTSGSLTPGHSVNLEDDASPRAVLSGASAALHAHHGTAMAPSVSALKPRSLLSTSLAAAGGRTPAPAGRPAPTAAAWQPSPQQQPSAAARPQVPLQQQQQQQRPAGLPPQAPQRPSFARVSPTGLNYSIDPAWQAPPIRTVKMKGAQH